MCETKTDWYIIVNPHAGSGKTMAAWAVAEKRLAELDIPYAVTYTGYKSHAKELAWDAARNGYRRILAVGGDGSVHEIFTGVLTYCEVEGVPAADFYLGVIPIGSGNDWIKSFQVPHDTLKVVDLISRSKFTQQDVVRVKTAGDKVCYMANIGGVGFDSHVCEQVNARKERGRRSRRIYINALIATLFRLKRFQAEIIGDGEGASAQMGRKRLADGVGKGRGIERIASQIPQATAELTAAGGEDSLGRADLAGIELHGRAGEDLGAMPLDDFIAKITAQIKNRENA